MSSQTLIELQRLHAKTKLTIQHALPLYTVSASLQVCNKVIFDFLINFFFSQSLHSYFRVTLCLHQKVCTGCSHLYFLLSELHSALSLKASCIYIDTALKLVQYKCIAVTTSPVQTLYNSFYVKTACSHSCDVK